MKKIKSISPTASTTPKQTFPLAVSAGHAQMHFAQAGSAFEKVSLSKNPVALLLSTSHVPKHLPKQDFNDEMESDRKANV